MRRIWELVLASTLIALAACTGGHQAPEVGPSRPASLSDVLTRAVAATRAAGSARVSQVTRMDTRGAGSTDLSTQTTQGELDFRSGVGEMTHAGAGANTLDLIFSPGSLYTSIAGVPELPFPKGKSWFVEVIPPAERSATAVLRAVEGAPSTPDDVLSLLSLGTRIQRIGHLSIRGSDTAGYAFLIAPSTLRGLVAGAPRSYQDIPKGFSPIPVRVWIDPSNRVLRVLVTNASPFDSKNPVFSNLHVQVTTQTDFLDYGVPVNITLPPPSEVLTQSQMKRFAAGQSTNGCRTGVIARPPGGRFRDCQFVLFPPERTP